MISKAVILALVVTVAVAIPVQVPATGSVNFQSPGYPNGYADNANFQWQITGTTPGGIQFDSVAFDTESGYDVLSFSESINGQSVVIGEFSGSNGPKGFRSQTSNVVASFTSDSSVTKSGFSVSARVPVCPFGQNLCPGSDSACISSSQYCDGLSDCPSGADENNCIVDGNCGNQAIRPDLSAGGFKRLISSMAKKPTGKIVGGTEVVPHSWPWQIIMLTSSGSHLCGGSILNNDWIMTAAHCCVAYSPSPSSYKVRVGAHNYQAAEASATTYDLSRVIVHPGYKSSTTENDFCLLKVAQPIVYSDQVSPVCLARETFADDTKCWVTGWGNTGANRAGNFAGFVAQIKAAEAGLVPKPKAELRLRQVDVNIVNQDTCDTAYGGRVTDDMICAAAPGKDSCQGDSGGPFVCEKDGLYQLVGVVSWGRGCAQPGYPGVYGRTSHVIAWINESVNN